MCVRLSNAIEYMCVLARISSKEIIQVIHECIHEAGRESADNSSFEATDFM